MFSVRTPPPPHLPTHSHSLLLYQLLTNLQLPNLFHRSGCLPSICFDSTPPPLPNSFYTLPFLLPPPPPHTHSPNPLSVCVTDSSGLVGDGQLGLTNPDSPSGQTISSDDKQWQRTTLHDGCRHGKITPAPSGD